MSDAPPASQTRRMLLAGALSVALIGTKSVAAAQQGLFAAARGVNPVLIARAAASIAVHHGAIWTHDVVGIADFGLPSSEPRFHLIDLLAGTTTSLLVAHGKGSDPDHTGMLQSFSNAEGSNATSEGAYLTGEAYSGIHGASRRLIGLDPSNAQAEARAIVIHSAWYANASMIATQGRLGRSDGCLAFGEADIVTVLARLGRGRLIYAGRG